MDNLTVTQCKPLCMAEDKQLCDSLSIEFVHDSHHTCCLDEGHEEPHQCGGDACSYSWKEDK